MYTTEYTKVTQLKAHNKIILCAGEHKVDRLVTIKSVSVGRLTTTIEIYGGGTWVTMNYASAPKLVSTVP